MFSAKQFLSSNNLKLSTFCPQSCTTKKYAQFGEKSTDHLLINSNSKESSCAAHYES